MATNPIFERTLAEMAKAFTTPKAPRADDTYTHEDTTCTLICDYRVLDYGNADDAPCVEVVEIQADFGGRNHVLIPMACLSGRMLTEIEACISEEVALAEYNRGQDAKDFPGGER